MMRIVDNKTWSRDPSDHLRQSPGPPCTKPPNSHQKRFAGPAGGESCPVFNKPREGQESLSRDRTIFGTSRDFFGNPGWKARTAFCWAAANGGVTDGGLRCAWSPFLEIGRNRSFPAFFALFRRARRPPGKSRKSRKRAFFLRCPWICLNPHLLNPHLWHPNFGDTFGLRAQTPRARRLL